MSSWLTLRCFEFKTRKCVITCSNTDSMTEGGMMKKHISPTIILHLIRDLSHSIGNF